MPDSHVTGAARVVLERAAGRVLVPGRYTPQGMARDEKGRPVPSTSRRAVQWSILGAVNRELASRRLHPTTEDRVHVAIMTAIYDATRDATAAPTDPAEAAAVLARAREKLAS